MLGFNTLGGSVEASIISSRDISDGVGVSAAGDITVSALSESHILAVLGCSGDRRGRLRDRVGQRQRCRHLRPEHYRRQLDSDDR